MQHKGQLTTNTHAHMCTPADMYQSWWWCITLIKKEQKFQFLWHQSLQDKILKIK